MLKIGHKIVCAIPFIIIILEFITSFDTLGTFGIIVLIVAAIAYLASRSKILKMMGFSEALATALSIFSAWTSLLLPNLILEIMNGFSFSDDPSFTIVTFACVAGCALCIVIHILTRKRKKLAKGTDIITGDPELIKTPAYVGADPYIFISYAHKDDHIVIPIVNSLKKKNYRIWYDEGIGTGSTWDENIAQHIKNCKVFIAFYSCNYRESKNCNAEMKYASKYINNRFIVFLDDAKLTEGNEMYYQEKQHLRLSKYSNCDLLLNDMSEAEGFESCLEVSQ